MCNISGHAADSKRGRPARDGDHRLRHVAAAQPAPEEPRPPAGETARAEARRPGGALRARGHGGVQEEVIERFSTHAREALAAAEREARSLKHAQIGTEHVLLGLLRVEESLAAQALRLMGVTHRKARRRITALVDTGHEKPTGPL